jgi:hypothetical protein
MIPDAACAHIGGIAAIKTAEHRVCDECVKIGVSGCTCGRARTVERHSVATALRSAMPPDMRASPAIRSLRRLNPGGGCIAIRMSCSLSISAVLSGEACQGRILDRRVKCPLQPFPGTLSPEGRPPAARWPSARTWEQDESSGACSGFISPFAVPLARLLQ